jgi:hypothetical protein
MGTEGRTELNALKEFAGWRAPVSKDRTSVSHRWSERVGQGTGGGTTLSPWALPGMFEFSSAVQMDGRSLRTGLTGRALRESLPGIVAREKESP